MQCQPDIFHDSLNTHRFTAFQNGSSQCSLRLVSDKDQAGSRIFHLLRQMIEDSSSGHHSRTGQNNPTGSRITDCARFINRPGKLEFGKQKWIFFF